MAPRPFWKGYLKLSLVTCPVAMTPATSETEKIRFHTLNRPTGNRVVSRYVDAESGRPVDEDELVKGYPRDEKSFVLLEDEELEAVKLESARTIDIESFAPADSVDWIWYEAPYYLTPDDPVGEEAYCVIRDAMRATGMVGVSRLVLNRRERAVLLKARDKGIELWALRFGDEVRDPSEVFGPEREKKLDPALLKLVSRLIEERKKPWSLDMVRDPVQERLIDIINEKKKGAPRAKAKAEPAPAPSNVISIMDALRRSVAAEGRADSGERQVEKAAHASETVSDQAPARRAFASFDRRRGGAEALPRIAGERGQSRRRVGDGEISRSDRRTEFIPAERHRDGRAGTRARRIGGDRGHAALVAQIVDQDLARPLRLGDGRDIGLRTVGRHRVGDRLGERLDRGPVGLGLHRRHDMQALCRPRS